MKKLSIVVPCHNEEDAAPVFLEAVMPILRDTDLAFEIVFVDDGSTDDTVPVILSLAREHQNVRLVELSRNFGKEAALTAGLTYAEGDAVVPMDCDLQDPPELIPEMVKLWLSGVKVVHAVRESRETDSWMKRSTAGAFYQLMDGITDVNMPANCGDYRLMDRAVVNAILSFPERNRFMKGIMAAAGFKSATVAYSRPPRAAGETKFNFWRLWNFALDGITGFSTVPLRMWTYLGVVVAGFAFIYAGWIIAKTLVWGVVTPGYATTTTVILFLGGIQLVGIGVLGEYIGRIVLETKRRPIFLVNELHGFEDRQRVVPMDKAIAARGAA